MQNNHLTDTIAIKRVSEDPKAGLFEIDGLYGGYGITVGNAIRRVLLSSLRGAAITQVKMKGASHEFTTLPGVKEDVVELMLNLKKVRLLLETDEAQVLRLKKKGESEVTAGDIEAPTGVRIVNPDFHLATLTEKQSELDFELTVEHGLGYVPAEVRKTEKLPIGVIALDAVFSPVTRVNFSVENMRVGERTDYNRLRVAVETDGTISPSAALAQASAILADHFTRIGGIPVQTFEASPGTAGAGSEKPKRARKKKE